MGKKIEIRRRQIKDDSLEVISEVLAWKCGMAYLVHATLRFFARQELRFSKFLNHIFFVSVASCVLLVVLGIGARY